MVCSYLVRTTVRGVQRHGSCALFYTDGSYHSTEVFGSFRQSDVVGFFWRGISASFKRKNVQESEICPARECPPGRLEFDRLVQYGPDELHLTRQDWILLVEYRHMLSPHVLSKLIGKDAMTVSWMEMISTNPDLRHLEVPLFKILRRA